MTRLAVLAILVVALASCHEGVQHLIAPVPPLPSVAPRVAPPTPTLPSLPTVTPTPQVEYHCDRYKVIWCELGPSWEEM